MGLNSMQVKAGVEEAGVAGGVAARGRGQAVWLWSSRGGAAGVAAHQLGCAARTHPVSAFPLTLCPLLPPLLQ